MQDLFAQWKHSYQVIVRIREAKEPSHVFTPPDADDDAGDEHVMWMDVMRARADQLVEAMKHDRMLHPLHCGQCERFSARG